MKIDIAEIIDKAPACDREMLREFGYHLRDNVAAAACIRSMLGEAFVWTEELANLDPEDENYPTISRVRAAKIKGLKTGVEGLVTAIQEALEPAPKKLEATPGIPVEGIDSDE